jgi:hypothetical protein
VVKVTSYGTFGSKQWQCKYCNKVGTCHKIVAILKAQFGGIRGKNISICPNVFIERKNLV